MSHWRIERLDKRHERSEFSCGKESLDQFIRQLVTQYEKRRLGRTFVATDADSNRVTGYYTLAAGSLDVKSLPKDERKKLPKHPVPTIHIGRLAVDAGCRGQRLGELLLFHALRAALDLSDRLGAFAVDVWAIDDEAKSFYVKYGFVELDDSPLHLLLPMKTIQELFENDVTPP